MNCWMCWSHQNVVYINISAAFTICSKIKNSIQNSNHNHTQTYQKSYPNVHKITQGIWNPKVDSQNRKNGAWKTRGGHQNRKNEAWNRENEAWKTGTGLRGTQYPASLRPQPGALCGIYWEAPATLSSNILIDPHRACWHTVRCRGRGRDF